MDTVAIVAEARIRWEEARLRDPNSALEIVVAVEREIAWLVERTESAAAMISADPTVEVRLRPGLEARLELLDRYRSLHRAMTDS